jgi:hypothetical protein
MPSPPSPSASMPSSIGAARSAATAARGREGGRERVRLASAWPRTRRPCARDAARRCAR